MRRLLPFTNRQLSEKVDSCQSPITVFLIFLYYTAFLMSCQVEARKDFFSFFKEKCKNTIKQLKYLLDFSIINTSNEEAVL